MDIRRCTLKDGDVSVSLLSLGGITQDWQVHGRSVVLGYQTPEDYLTNPAFLGVLVGRVANRIGGAAFDLNGQRHVVAANDGANQLHGGPEGWWAKAWKLEQDGPQAAILSLQSPDGDMGFPGAVDVRVRISLDEYRLTYDMTAIPDRETPISMANHNYYNLAGSGTIWDHKLRIGATQYTPVGEDLIPLGHLAPVADTPHDYRSLRPMAEANPNYEVTDLNFALEADKAPACELVAPDGMHLKLWTDQPGLQVFTGQAIAPRGTPLAGQSHGPCTGLAIEAQGFPDTVNQPGFPSQTCTPVRPYRQVTTIEIAPSDG
jgi:aldose 1-epimerase